MSTKIKKFILAVAILAVCTTPSYGGGSNPASRVLTLEEADQLDTNGLYKCLGGHVVSLNGEYRTGCLHSYRYGPGQEELSTYIRQKLVSRHPEWDEDVKKKIVAGELVLGMNEEQVMSTCGKPRDVNRTITARGSDEQWVYELGSDRAYLYFENGVFTSYQD